VSFIPYFHFKPASEKLTPKWWSDVVDFYIYNNQLVNLLDKKNIEEIEGYSDGSFDMRPFKRIFRSLRKQAQQENNPNIRKQDIADSDKTGLQWDQLALIPPKLNSAVAINQKIPLEIKCTCIDPLAQKKRDEDFEFLKSKPEMEETLQPLYDSMNLGEVDLGTTKHSDVPYNSLPMDLDIYDDEEFKIFANLIYNLAPEAAFENILQYFYDIKKVSNIKGLEILDQYKFGVSVNQARLDKITKLPTVEYIYPNQMQTDQSLLPDFSDNIVRVRNMVVTPLELLNYFPDEIKNEKALEEIVNGRGQSGKWGAGYCGCNGDAFQHSSKWNAYKMHMKYIEVKSVDSVTIGANNKKSKYRFFTDDESISTGKVWGQNTYCVYWLNNTKWFFGADKLDFAHRSPGNETYQNFSTNIYRSQKKSAVELCIGENKKAQIADVKLQHAIIMSSPDGKVIDMKYLRKAVEGLTGELGSYTAKDLLDKAMEENVHIIDTDGFENRQSGSQFLPVRDLPGGLKNNIEGYYRVILEAASKISMLTNINDQITGQSANPEGLVGLQKLLINGGVNALNYINEAIKNQYTPLFTIWATVIKRAIKDGGKPKQAIENVIGRMKAGLIKDTDGLGLHDIGVVVSMGMREEERAAFKQEIFSMRQKGILTSADVYYILNTPNPKDAMWLAAVAEKKFYKRQDRIRQEQMAANQQMVAQQGENMLQNTQAQTQGRISEKQAQGEVEASLMQLGSQLGMGRVQLEGLIKRQIQKERLDGQTNKSLKTMFANSELEKQKAFV
jgi:hypothetical protein